MIADVAKITGATIRVSGQRHSQPPLVVDDNRDAAPQTTREYLVDMSCYKDLGPGQDQHIVLGPGTNHVTVNTGVREDELDAFLTQNSLMLKTVTAGGFFIRMVENGLTTHLARVDVGPVASIGRTLLKPPLPSNDGLQLTSGRGPRTRPLAADPGGWD